MRRSLCVLRQYHVQRRRKQMKELMLIIISSAIVNNVVLSQFLGLCPFLGVSNKINTAAGMGGAIIFVITLSSFVTGLVYQFILVPTDMEYLQTIVFILIIAALVQFVEMFLKKAIPSLYQALGVYLPLITTNCAVQIGRASCREREENTANEQSLKTEMKQNKEPRQIETKRAAHKASHVMKNR